MLALLLQSVSAQSYLTWYSPSPFPFSGYCALNLNGPTDYYVSMSSNVADYNRCGQCVQITYNGKTVVAPFVDKCATNCHGGVADLDVSPAIFSLLSNTGDLSQGVLNNPVWSYVDCPAGWTFSYSGQTPGAKGYQIASIVNTGRNPVGVPASVPAASGSSGSSSGNSQGSNICPGSGKNCGAGCCSQYGYCSNDAAKTDANAVYCDPANKCNALAGTCWAASGTSTGTGSTGNTGGNSGSNSGGSSTGTGICPGSGKNCGAGCCSQYGYCSNDAAKTDANAIYCDPVNKCNALAGTCWAASGTSTGTGSTGNTGGNSSGSSTGTGICPGSGKNCGAGCCSQYGYCSNDAAKTDANAVYCDPVNKCNALAGTCWTSSTGSSGSVVGSAPPKTPVSDVQGCSSSVYSFCSTDGTYFSTCNWGQVASVVQCYAGTHCINVAGGWAMCTY
ncbi:hypothetical protein HDV01_002738 [Terramyces sp. JEL0728]|nr:hypothetical protein HDV01_002738 [Terramyces sp. JEL0728]